jgi:hypothetical protein
MLPCRRRAINALRAQEARQAQDIFVGRPIDEGYADMSLSYTSVITPKEPAKITAKKSRKKK